MKYFCILGFWVYFCNSQELSPYTDYSWCRSSQRSRGTSSNDDQRVCFPQKAEGQKTISGEGLTGKRNEMARFLTCRSFGFSGAGIKRSDRNGY
ncbi:MAG: hypothetical protein IPG18_15385 [Saprospiraceae bacterium]|nr:hypothetical protein [Saprospiraceae bacterium]